VVAAAVLVGCGDERRAGGEDTAPQATAAAPQAGTEFSESGVPFRFRVPEGWRVQRGAAAGEMEALVVLVPPAGTGPGAAVQLTASRRIPGGGGTNLETALDGVAAGVKAQGATSYAGRGRRDVMVGDYRGREETAEFGGQGGQTLAMRTVVFSDGFRIFGLSLVAPPTALATYERDFEAILGSFETAS
jgi:hypothetical protein